MYINVHSSITHNSKKVEITQETINDEWMRPVVEYELIPLLKEYWFDEAVKVKDWSRTLREVVK